MKKFFIALGIILILASSSLAFDMPWDLGTKYCKLVQKTAAPTSSDYTYQIGTVWIDTSTEDSYVLVDNTASAAVWNIIDTRYKTIYIPASAFTSTATSGATFGTYEYVTNDINADFYTFGGATEQFVETQFPMPEDWNLGTIKAKAHWSSATGSTAGDTCEWEIQGGALSNDDAIDAALGTSQVISDVLLADNGADMQLSGATPAITIGGTPALADMVHFKVSRNVGGTDNMTENAWLFGVWVQYLANVSVVAW